MLEPVVRPAELSHFSLSPSEMLLFPVRCYHTSLDDVS